MALTNYKTGKYIELIKKEFLSIFALVVSFLSAYFSIISYRDTVTQQAIDSTYKTFYDISAASMSNSDLIHLCAMPEMYSIVQKEIHLSLMPINQKKRAEYSLKERAFANYLFGFYENTLLQYHESIKKRNTDRTNFLKGILDYFRAKVLRNPRLLYLWDRDGGKLSMSYAKFTIEDHDKNVLNNKDNPLIISVDSVVPYYIDSINISPRVK